MPFPIPKDVYDNLDPDTRHCVELVERLYFYNLEREHPNCIILPVKGPAKHIFGNEVALWAERIQPDVDAFVHSTPEFLEWLLKLAMRGLGVPARFEGGTYVFMRGEFRSKLHVEFGGRVRAS